MREELGPSLGCVDPGPGPGQGFAGLVRRVSLILEHSIPVGESHHGVAPPDPPTRRSRRRPNPACDGRPRQAARADPTVLGARTACTVRCGPRAGTATTNLAWSRTRCPTDQAHPRRIHGLGGPARRDDRDDPALGRPARARPRGSRHETARRGPARWDAASGRAARVRPHGSRRTRRLRRTPPALGALEIGTPRIRDEAGLTCPRHGPCPSWTKHRIHRKPGPRRFPPCGETVRAPGMEEP